MDPVSRPTDASVQVDGRIVPVGQVHQTSLQCFWWEKVCTMACILYSNFFTLGFGLFAIHMQNDTNLKEMVTPKTVCFFQSAIKILY